MKRQQSSTLRALDEYDGTVIIFDDFVRAGDTVEVTSRGERIVYLDDDGEWWLRPLNDFEREQRIKKVLGNV